MRRLGAASAIRALTTMDPGSAMLLTMPS